MKRRAAVSYLVGAMCFFVMSNSYASDIDNFFYRLKQNMQEKAEDVRTQKNNDDYEDKTLDVTLESAVKAFEVTPVGEKVNNLRKTVKDYSKVTLIGTEDGVDIKSGVGEEDKEKKYEVSLSANIRDYKPCPRLEARFSGMEMVLGYDVGDRINSEFSSKKLNDKIGCRVNFSSQYDHNDGDARAYVNFEIDF